MNKRVRAKVAKIRDECIYVGRAYWMPLFLTLRWFDKLFNKIDRIASKGLRKLN